jgi:hypothetical protein
MIENVRLRILLVALSGWVNRHQLEVIAYLREENRVLKEHVDGRHVRLTDAQRRRLAVNGHRLGGQVLREVATLSRRTPFCGGIDSSLRRAGSRHRVRPGASTAGRGSAGFFATIIGPRDGSIEFPDSTDSAAPQLLLPRRVTRRVCRDGSA